MTKAIDKMAKKYKRNDTEINTVCSHKGPRTIESSYEGSLVAEGVLKYVITGNKEDYDAIIIACYSDVHLQSAREISNIPVYGIAESSMHFASILGYKFSIVTVLERSRPLFEKLVISYGLQDRCASISTTSVSVDDLEKDPSITRSILTEAGKKAIKEDGAEVICLGCAGMCELDKPIEKELGVPVLDSVVCAVKFAEAFYDYGLNMSKIKAYKMPIPKEMKNMTEFE